MADRYRTLAGPAEGEFKVRGSRHIAFVAPVRSADAAQAFLDGLRKTHHGARHHCFAYRLGADGEFSRASDDGEPAHSAGTPILGALRSRELTQTVAVVVRYFGGIKLGVPGLIEAYREATFAALDRADIVEKDVLTACTLTFPFHRIGEVMRWVKAVDGAPEAPESGPDAATLRVVLPQARAAEAERTLAVAIPFGITAKFTPIPLG